MELKEKPLWLKKQCVVHEGYCNEDCPWWVDGQCAIPAIAISLRQMIEILDEIRRAILTKK